MTRLGPARPSRNALLPVSLLCWGIHGRTAVMMGRLNGDRSVHDDNYHHLTEAEVGS